MEGQKKSETIAKYKLSSADTGSPEVQVALLTDRLESLSKHFQGHAKDNHSKRGMLRLVSRRARLLNYLKDTDVNRYRTLVASLGLRK